MEDITKRTYTDSLLDIIFEKGLEKAVEKIMDDLQKKLVGEDSQAEAEGLISRIKELEPMVRSVIHLIDAYGQLSKEYRKARFGSKTEVIQEFDLSNFLTPEEQENLPDEIINGDQSDENQGEEEKKTPGKKSRKNNKTGKTLMDSENLRRLDEYHETIPSDPNMVIVRTHTETVLEYTPGEYYLVNHIYPVYQSPDSFDDNGNPKTEIPGKEPLLIENSPATPSLVAHLCTSMYLLAVPGYRQEKDFNLRGIYLSRQTIFNWLDSVHGIYLDRLYTILQEDFQNQNYVHLDETTVSVVQNKKEKARNYMLCGVSGRSEKNQIVLFKYSESRSNEIVTAMVGKDFKGIIQSDGYAAYTSYAKNHPEVLQVGCLVHALVKFKEALELDDDYNRLSHLPNDERMKEFRKPEYACLRNFLLIKLLMGQMITRDTELPQNGMSWDEIREDRQKIALPVMNEIFRKAEQLKNSFPKKSKKGKAIKYLLNQKEQLMAVLKDGRCEMSNLPAERKIKGFVLWRKNALFCNTENGAERTAGIMSLLQTAQANGLNPEEYLRDLLDSLRTKNYEDSEIRDQLLPYSKNLFKDLKVAREAESAKKASEAIPGKPEKPKKLRRLAIPGQSRQRSVKRVS